jgi:hypothetical protein
LSNSLLIHFSSPSNDIFVFGIKSPFTAEHVLRNIISHTEGVGWQIGNIKMAQSREMEDGEQAKA